MIGKMGLKYKNKLKSLTKIWILNSLIRDMGLLIVNDVKKLKNEYIW